MHQAALVAIRNDPHAERYYQTKRDQGKSHRTALTAVARRHSTHHPHHAQNPNPLQPPPPTQLNLTNRQEHPPSPPPRFRHYATPPAKHFFRVPEKFLNSGPTHPPPTRPQHTQKIRPGQGGRRGVHVTGRQNTW